MTVPICPKHGVPMKAGKYPGTYFCSKLDPEGPKGYCTQRTKLDPRGEPGNLGESVQAVVQAVAQRQNRQEGPQDALQREKYPTLQDWSIVLETVARIYQGTGKGVEAVEIAAALRALLP